MATFPVRVLLGSSFFVDTYKDILSVLEERCGIKRSLTWLKLKLKKLGLRRRHSDSNYSVVKALIIKILETSEQVKGYRAVWKHLRDKYNCIVRRDVVMLILREVDAAGVSFRSQKRFNRRIYTNKGPNFMWHIDGYDKLSPYGISIHGCIDGKMMWLKVSPTNHDPRVVARFYLECLEEVAGVPKFL
uniref:Integrase core domain-containing protein n=1 Tax=Amphimedon queenslandica TaxID=400682 RepID=A0A1X7TGC1_AMPQE